MWTDQEQKVDLTYEDIVALKANKEIMLVDLREHEEIRETGQLPDSVHIPLGELSAALQLPADEFSKKFGCASADVAAKGAAPLVFSCRSGYRSRRAMNEARQLGFTQARHYVGGFADWQLKHQSR